MRPPRHDHVGSMTYDRRAAVCETCGARWERQDRGWQYVGIDRTVMRGRQIR